MNDNKAKKELISAIFKILLLFEDIADTNSKITEQDYLRYLNRLYVRFIGRENTEISDIIKGMSILGTSLTKDSVKSNVFHMIEIINKGDVDIGSEIL